MTQISVVTASWTALYRQSKQGPLDVVPVRTSVGKPRFWPAAEEFPSARELTPYGLLSIEDWAEFEQRYLERLDRFGVARIMQRLESLAASYGSPLALACFELDREDCHRRLAAAWLERHAGLVVPEWLERPTKGPVGA